jgi:hypothetical protein
MVAIIRGHAAQRALIRRRTSIQISHACYLSAKRAMAWGGEEFLGPLVSATKGHERVKALQAAPSTDP